MASSIYGIYPRHLLHGITPRHLHWAHNPAISRQNIPGFLGFLRQYPFLGIYMVCVHDWTMTSLSISFVWKCAYWERSTSPCRMNVQDDQRSHVRGVFKVLLLTQSIIPQPDC